MSDAKELNAVVDRAISFFHCVHSVEKVDKREFLMALHRRLSIELGLPVRCLNQKCQNQMYVKSPDGGSLVCAQCGTPRE
jgi:hypothetical protein